MKNRLRIPALLAVLVLSGNSALAAEVGENWTKHCASCHGKEGKGDTKAGKKADAKDLTDPKYQASFTDEQMFKQIKDGMKDAKGKEKMKPFGGILSDDEINALVKHVRGLKQ
ncbi:MAG: c-type cytochrome [Verrucomicrobia subdivision 3 bacterium]|nr:c-type cytochrome [Limisphaerales bacterium]